MVSYALSDHCILELLASSRDEAWGGLQMSGEITTL